MLPYCPGTTECSDSFEVSKYESRDDDEWDPEDTEQLMPHERFWRSHAPFLKEHGYILRPRFRADWVASWHVKDLLYMEIQRHYEDGAPLGVRTHFTDSRPPLTIKQPKAVMDAIRITDNKMVGIKQIRSASLKPEIEIANMFSSEPLASNPRNHCVRILDYFHDEAEPDVAFLVMPLLRPFDNPPFYSVDEMIEFIRQTLQV